MAIFLFEGVWRQGVEKNEWFEAESQSGRKREHCPTENGMEKVSTQMKVGKRTKQREIASRFIAKSQSARTPKRQHQVVNQEQQANSHPP